MSSSTSVLRGKTAADEEEKGMRGPLLSDLANLGPGARMTGRRGTEEATI